MNPLMGLLALLAVSTVNAGVFELPQHDGYQTPFVPVQSHASHSEHFEAAPQALQYSQPQAGYLPLEQAHYEEAHLHAAPVAVHESGHHLHAAAVHESAHLATAQYQVAAGPLQAAQYQAYQPGHAQAVSLHAGHVHAAPAPILSAPVALTHAVQPVLPQPTVQLQKTIIKHVQVPYPVDKYVKVDRQVPYYVNKHYKVDRPYEVVKYVQKPYIVKVERKVHVPIIQKVPVPQPIIQVEPVIAEPQHIRAEHHDHHEHYDHHDHHDHHEHHPW